MKSSIFSGFSCSCISCIHNYKDHSSFDTKYTWSNGFIVVRFHSLILYWICIETTLYRKDWFPFLSCCCCHNISKACENEEAKACRVVAWNSSNMLRVVFSSQQRLNRPTVNAVQWCHSLPENRVVILIGWLSKHSHNYA